MHPTRRGLALIAAGLPLLAIGRANAEVKPRPAPGRDPGGRAVGLIGEGVDYQQPGIAQRLARDGEGEPIGKDFIDGGSRPLARPPEPATSLARVVLDEGQASRLVVVRIGADDPSRIVPALHFVAHTPAVVVGLLPPPPMPLIPEDRLGALAQNVPQLLVVVAARRLLPAAAERPNVLVVGAIGASGQSAATASARADVAVDLRGWRSKLVEASLLLGGEPEDVAVARVVALAARVLAVKPGLAGAALKAEIVSLGVPIANASPQTPRHGGIGDIRRIHWLE